MFIRVCFNDEIVTAVCIFKMSGVYACFVEERAICEAVNGDNMCHNGNKSVLFFKYCYCVLFYGIFANMLCNYVIF